MTEEVEPAAPCARTEVLASADVSRAVVRIAHEIAEKNRGLDGVVVVGIQRGGVWLADLLVEAIERHENVRVPNGMLDVSMYRDDIGLRPVLPTSASNVPAIDGKTVILCDDVLFTGRTIRSALDALSDYGRARAVQLAVLVDRGHRELPIRPDFIGKNLPTSGDERVIANADGVVIEKPL